jgi:hypothetical protein
MPLLGSVTAMSDPRLSSGAEKFWPFDLSVWPGCSASEVHGESSSTLPRVFQDWEIILKAFVKRCGDPYSGMIGIDLQSRKNGKIVKWFLASILYEKPIRESTVTNSLYKDELSRSCYLS